MTHNVHDFRAMNHLAGSFHEAAHCVVGLKLGRTLERLTRYETKFVPKPDDTPANRAAVCYAGALAVAKFDNGQNLHAAEDSGDRANVERLNLDPADADVARIMAADLIAEYWQKICDVAHELDASPTGELDPQRVADLVA